MNLTQGCAGSCNQGRSACNCPCARYDGTARDTQPGELLPNTPDPAEGVGAGWWAFGFVVASAFLGVGLAQWWRA